MVAKYDRVVGVPYLHIARRVNFWRGSYALPTFPTLRVVLPALHVYVVGLFSDVLLEVWFITLPLALPGCLRCLLHYLYPCVRCSERCVSVAYPSSL